MRIKDIKINNYKSLVDFGLTSLSPMTIIYGENNSGKSNVLEFIYNIFKRKRQFDGEEMTEQLVNFHSGILENFNYSFFENDLTNNIEFEVVLLSSSVDCEIEPTEFGSIFGAKIDDDVEYKFFGTIKKHDNSKSYAIFEINKLEVNNISIYTNDSSQIHYFPDTDTEKKNQSKYSLYFENIIAPFDDCVFFVPSHRDMLPIKFGADLEEIISPVKFKQFLYSLSLNEDEYGTFERINSLFGGEPFSYGNISFSKIEDKLEIMVQKDGIRLPIKSLGSGVLQILYIISCIVYSRKSIICLEELEQNLSPKNQELAIKKLESMISQIEAPNQLIISSHSPYFYEKDSDNSSYLLGKNGTRTVRLAKNGKYPSADEDYNPKEMEYFKEHFPEAENFY
ncbi:MAG: ATP-binding protein [Flavobacteriaceae bacterium]|nr:ATP-binding protein [Flavobacteriaceae bacterium]